MTRTARLRPSKGDYPYDEGRHLTLVLELQAWADESGDIYDSHCTFAGFIASPRQWKLFRAKWREVLDRWRVPAFHAMYFFPRVAWQSSKSPYRGWTEDEALAFQRELTDVYVSQYRNIHRASGSVDINDYKQINEDWQRIFTGAMIKWNVRDGAFTSKLSGTGKPVAPWFLCFIDFVQHILTFAPEGSVVHLTCDTQADCAPLALITWNNMKKRKAQGWQKMGGLSFESDDCFEPLQLADMYANLLNHSIPQYGQGTLRPDRAEALAALMKDGKGVYMHNLETLERRARDISDSILQEIAVHYDKNA